MASTDGLACQTFIFTIIATRENIFFDPSLYFLFVENHNKIKFEYLLWNWFIWGFLLYCIFVLYPLYLITSYYL